MKNWMEFIKQPIAKPEYGGRVLISKEVYDEIQEDAIRFPVRTRTNPQPVNQLNQPNACPECGHGNYMIKGEFIHSCPTEGQEKIYQSALEMIEKICKSNKHKDPISDILCECNRAKRLISESQNKEVTA